MPTYLQTENTKHVAVFNKHVITNGNTDAKRNIKKKIPLWDIVWL